MDTRRQVTTSFRAIPRCMHASFWQILHFLSMLMPPGRVAVSIPLVGQDSNLVVRRIPDDTLEILFHALTQCQRWDRLAAFTVSWQPPKFTSHRPIIIWHSPPAIRRLRGLFREPPGLSLGVQVPADPVEHASQFALKWWDKLDKYTAVRMEGLGIPLKADRLERP